MRSQAGRGGPNYGAEGRETGYGWDTDGAEGGRERGTRRKKVYGYLKAANELRQTYSAQLAQKYQDAYEDRRDTASGSTDAEAVTYGNEEMVLFPSYARRHVQRETRDQSQPERDASQTGDKLTQTSQDLEYWRREWDKQEDQHAVMDVDVKGWIYSPRDEPMSRKNRVLIALARRLSGIPAPDPSLGGDNDTLANNEANAIINEDQNTSGQLGEDSSMSQSEIAAANVQLMERLNPFLTNPVVGLLVTIFFFNDKQSQSRTVSTNPAGHFYIRAALDFVPTRVRVLAGEHLSATSEIKIIEPRGVSLISDIDDTIKHSSIASGAKEMFRNTFVRNLDDLTVLGVKEWYAKMVDMGVGMHYVSNSPWQLYPLLKSFFHHAGLPPGSFHLRQFTGMLQGIFEPTAERKRPTLEKIMQDFPDRRFILVGDSGEADLEVYTELVLANPGKVLAIFIRDVTTPNSSRFFDKSFSYLEKPRAASGDNLADRSDVAEKRPSLPPRNHMDQVNSDPAQGAPVGQLIDFDSEDGKSTQNAPSVSDPKPTAPPVPGPKPTNLRTGSLGNGDSNNKGQPIPPNLARKPVPPIPEKPGRLSSAKIDPQPQRPNPPVHSRAHISAQNPSNNEGRLSGVRNQVSNAYNNLPPTRELWESLPSSDQILPSALTSQSTNPRSKKPPPVPPPRRSTNNTNNVAPASQSTPNLVRPSTSSSTLASSQRLQPSHITPPRARTPPPSTFPVSSSSSSSTVTDQSSVAPNKREEMWKRRWVRAQEILTENGVILASWRDGSDVQDLCVQIVETAQKDDQNRSASSIG